MKKPGENSLQIYLGKKFRTHLQSVISQNTQGFFMKTIPHPICFIDKNENTKNIS